MGCLKPCYIDFRLRGAIRPPRCHQLVYWAFAWQQTSTFLIFFPETPTNESNSRSRIPERTRRSSIVCAWYKRRLWYGIWLDMWSGRMLYSGWWYSSMASLFWDLPECSGQFLKWHKTPRLPSQSLLFYIRTQLNRCHALNVFSILNERIRNRFDTFWCEDHPIIKSSMCQLKKWPLATLILLVNLLYYIRTQPTDHDYHHDR